MPKGPLFPSEFTATQWSTQADKAEFGNALLQFIESDFKRTLLTKKLYNRLSMTFGHIAHYCQGQFYEEWFVEEPDRARFVEHLLRWPCYGDSAFTFSDVERALQREVQRRNYLCRFQSIADAALRTKEVAVLERLEAKYRRTNSSETGILREHIDPPFTETPRLREPFEPIQGTLF